jgi:hypothetical protein
MGDATPSSDPERRRFGWGAIWIAGAILAAAIIISVTIWATRPKADPQSSRAACEDAGGSWLGELNDAAVIAGLSPLPFDCDFPDGQE